MSTARDLLEIDLSSILASDTWSWLEEDVTTSGSPGESTPYVKCLKTLFLKVLGVFTYDIIYCAYEMKVHFFPFVFHKVFYRLLKIMRVTQAKRFKVYTAAVIT